MQAYDYRQTGAYFVTISTQKRACLFGDIADGKMVLNDPGRMVETVWNEIPPHYFGIETDAFVIRPNHIHGIVVIVGAGPRACPEHAQPQDIIRTQGNHRGLPLRVWMNHGKYNRESIVENTSYATKGEGAERNLVQCIF